MRYFGLLVGVILCIGCQSSDSQKPLVKKLENWSFRSTNDSEWLKAKVPGSVTQDLFLLGEIEDPYVGNNALSLQWISKTDWDYQTTFEVSEAQLKKANHQLRFEGLDTYAEVRLNGQVILETDNAFRRWEVDVSPLIKSINNLRITFNNHHDIENTRKKTELFIPPADDMSDDKQRRVYTRRPQYQYGWDWAPRLITPGIWRQAILVSWDKAKIKQSAVELIELNDNTAQLEVSLSLEQTALANITADVFVNGALFASKVLNANEVNNIIPFQIINPKKWWPHNIGEPYLYDICVQINHKSSLVDEICYKKGLRTIDLITDEDDGGESFYFKINGVPVFMKGANYVPLDAMTNSGNIKEYEAIINNAVEANMNTLRVWGGGVYEHNDFYSLCDQKGVMVWQDFMFACAMYPGSEKFLKNVRLEAEDNVRRIGNYASVVLWCGNNESSEGWANWGWKSGKSDAEKKAIWAAYEKVFKEILPETIETYGQNVPYWESSPKYGRGNSKYISEGDAHDWFVWHDNYPFEHFENSVPRFMSEFGFQSLPSEGVVTYATGGTLDLNSPEFDSHQKHPRGTALIETYMARDFPLPRNDKEQVYLSQLTQAYGISKAIVAHRSAMPYTMGSLFWQLNDCWPSVSWSSVDYLGQWKALQYAAEHDFDNLLIAAKTTKDGLMINIINDNLEPLSDVLNVEFFDFDGNSLYAKSMPYYAPGNANEIADVVPLNFEGFNPQSTVGVLRFTDKQTLIYFDRPKNLSLKASAINIQLRQLNDGYEATLYSDVLQKSVYISSRSNIFVSPNFIDLLPNQPVTVFIRTSDDSTVPILSVLSLNQFD